MTEKKVDLEAELDALFRTPLKDFIRSRKDLASRLKKTGDRENAARVGAITKPSLSAWGVNQLFWLHSNDFEKLLEAGDEIRRIQHQALAGDSPQGDLKSAQKERQRAIDGLLKRAEIVLLQNGHAASPDVLKRISTTLEAAAAYGSAQPDPGPGRLRQDLELPGFERLAELALLPPPASTAKPAVEKPEADAEKLRAAQKQIQKAEAELSLRKAETKRTLSGLELAEGRVIQMQKDFKKLQDQLARLEQRLRQSEKDLDQAKSAVDSAKAAEEKAARSLASARKETDK